MGRVDGLVVFVPGAAPGDRLRVRVTAAKRNLLEAEILEILAPSPVRRTAPCPVFGRCGGCRWQHVEYETQAQQKEKILRDSLRRLNPAPEWLPFLPAPREFGYRNRIQLQIEGERWGFFAARSRELVSFDRCLITEDAINDELHRHRPTDFPNVGKVEFANLEGGGGVRVMAGERDPGAALFAQVNTLQNEVLKTRLGELAIDEVDWFMDLYAGAGNLTAPLRQKFPDAHGTAVEFSRASVERARAAGASVEWIAADVARALTDLKPRNGRGLIVLDPPRVGVEARVVDGVVRHRPRQIIYVSCNPATFARDAERVLAAGPYRLTQVQGLDMFPQTEHVELIASFTRQTGV